jgi:nucleotide-binding universal stress UspA family protein
MALRDLLVCLDGTAAGDGRLALALKLAQTNRAHLSGVHVLPALPGVTVPPAPPAWVGLPPTILGPASPVGAAAVGGEPVRATEPAAPVLQEIERASISEQHFREELQLHALDGEWHVLGHTGLPELIALARGVDLAIFGQYSSEEANGAAWPRPDDVMLDLGRPVLLVPYAGTFEHVGKRVLVAWNDTREANRALHDALPLIGGAEMVTVMHIGAQPADLDRDRPLIERIVRHLQRHGIKAQAEESPRGDIAISEVLLSRAADLGADMIVAGAYHHSPLREALLGGVSRGLLDHMTVPVLMSH